MNTRLVHAFLRVLGSRFLFSLALLPVPDAAALSQRARTYFGPRIDFNPGFSVASVALERISGEASPTVFISGMRRNELHRFSVKRSGKLDRVNTSEIPDRGSFLKLQQGRLFLFTPETSEVVLLSETGDRPDIPLRGPAGADRIAFADVTNDGVSDLLFFGKGTPGITLNRGKANGFEGAGSVVLADMSASDVVATDLNGDRITDLFVGDWLSNKIVLYLGIGRGVFSEQVSVHLPGEPSFLSFHPEKGGKDRIAVSLPDLRQVQVFNVNALGEFKTESLLPCPGPPGMIRFIDIDRDGVVELLTATGEELLVFSQQNGRFRSQPSLYASGGRVVDWTVDDLDGDDFPDCVLVTRDPSRIVLIGNSAHSGSIRWPSVYAVGRAPRGLATGV